MKNSITLKPVKPSWAIGNAYRLKILKLVKSMINDIMPSIEAEYKANEKQITLVLNDSVNDIYKTIKKKFLKWQDIFNKLATKYSIKFVEDVDNSVTRQLKSSLQEIPQLKVVPFSKYNQQILIAQKSIIQENVSLIKSIPAKMHDQVEFHVTQAVSRGRDLKYLEENLLKISNITEKRAKLIARDQVDKATSVINHARYTELGITKSKWVYTYISKEPRESHKKANGTIYEISKGCEIDGEFIYPADKINCFPPETLINHTYGIEGSFRRWYSGELTQFITKCGTIIKTTPNHPILTLRGWVKTDFMNIGDYTIQIDIIDSIASNSHSNKSKTSISDIFTSFNVLCAHGNASSTIVRNADFHGENIINQDIDIILTNSKLMYSVDSGNFIQQFQNFPLTFTNQPPLDFSTVFQLIDGKLSSTQCLISFLSNEFSFLDTTLLKSQNICFGITSDFNIIIKKSFSDDRSCNIISLSYSIFRHPIVIGFDNIINRQIFDNILKCIMPSISQITCDSLCITIIDFCNFSNCDTLIMKFDEIVNISRIKYEGHVYNLQTKNGFYFANGVLYHNCQCISAPVIEF